MFVQDIALLLGADFEGNGELDLLRAAPLDEAGDADLAFVTSGKDAVKRAMGRDVLDALQDAEELLRVCQAHTKEAGIL